MKKINALILSNKNFETFEEFINVSDKLNEKEWEKFKNFCLTSINTETWKQCDIILGCKITDTTLKNKFNIPM